MDLQEVQSKFEKAINLFCSKLQNLRSGHIDSHLIDALSVDYYGRKMPIKALAHTSDNSHAIVIQPYDPDCFRDILKVLVSNNYQAYEATKNIININRVVPSGEDKEKIATHINEFGEEAKVAIRNIRQTFRRHFVGTEDEKRISEKKITNLYDQSVKLIDDTIEKKIAALKIK